MHPGPDAVPRTFDEAAWMRWARETLGGWKFDREQRAIEHQCVDDLKAKGILR